MITSEYQAPGMLIRDHQVEVPLVWPDLRRAREPDGRRTIALFAREIVRPSRARDDLPVLLYLQGGPGGKALRPVTKHDAWLPDALDRYRVVLLDQRGTGRSTPLQASDAAGWATAEQGRDLLLRLRADSIVRDAEFLREHEFGVPRWSTLGQSYGGFLTLTYLSFFPQSLERCYVAGGLASIRPSADELYRHTFPRIAAKNEQYFARYPADQGLVDEVADLLASQDVRLPDGDRLTVRRLQTLGNDFGMKPSFERMHWLFDEAFAGGHGHGRLSDTFLAAVGARTGFDTNPLYAILQESIYASGQSGAAGAAAAGVVEQRDAVTRAGATAWAAQRERSRRPEFAETARPLRFTGETMFPWMLDEIRALRPFREPAAALAEWTDWSPLYDPVRLAANEVPVFAAVYHDDMYVPCELSLATAREFGEVHTWVTNEFEHDGLRTGNVLSRLFAQADDLAPVR